MDTSASVVPASSWRAETSEIDFGSAYLQFNRLDVLVHLLAFEQLTGETPLSASDHDWVMVSDQFATRDNDPTVATLAAEVLTSPEADLTVTFASGGQLVRGASCAAVALGSGRPAVRCDGADKVIDRSAHGLLDSGWTTNQLHQLLIEWARRDEAAAVVFVDLDAEGAEAAIHELMCRYGLMYQALDFVSAEEAAQLALSSSGSTQVLCLRAGDGLNAVLGGHSPAIRGAVPGQEAANALATMWQNDRTTEAPSPSHSQRVRKMRRRQMADQLLDRTFRR